jgi:fructokinase
MGKRVICAGEVLYDFISTEVGHGLAGSTHFEKKPGGSPFNIAIGLARLDVPVGFLVKLSDDELGVAIEEFLAAEGVDTSFLVSGAGYNTALSLTAVGDDGKAEFRFYRADSADTSLTIGELPDLREDETSAFLLGSIALADDPVGGTLMSVYERMRGNGVLTVFDPNVRPLYVERRPIYRERAARLIKEADVLKLSEDDLYWLTGSATRYVDDNLDLLEYNRSGLVILTEGERGARVIWKGEETRVPGYSVSVTETTSCGDAFAAGILSKLLPLGREGMRDMTSGFLNEAAKWANACAAVVSMRCGAADSMPYAHEVEKFMKKHQERVADI